MRIQTKVAVIVLMLLASVRCLAQQQTITPNCTGNAITDTATLTSLTSTLGTTNLNTIAMPLKPTSATLCKFNNFTFTANLTLDLTNGGIQVVNGQTVTIVGPFTAPAKQVFFNATAGQGTISFANNKSINGLDARWWGTVTVPLWNQTINTPASDSVIAMQAAKATMPTWTLKDWGAAYLRSDGVLFMESGMTTYPDGSTPTAGLLSARIQGDTGYAISIVSGAPTQAATARRGAPVYIYASDGVPGSSVDGAETGGYLDIRSGDAKRRNSGNANGPDIHIIPGSGIGTGHPGYLGIGTATPTSYVHIANVAPVMTIQDTGNAGFAEIGRIRFTDSAATERLGFGLVGDGSGDAEFNLSNDKLFHFTANAVDIVTLGSPTVGGPNTGLRLMGDFRLGNNILLSYTAPTLSGFGTSPSVPNHNGGTVFTINVGTGGTASTGTINLAPSAAVGWVCAIQDITHPDSFVTNMTGFTVSTVTVKNYSRTTGLQIAWTASDILAVTCHGL